MDLVVKEEQTSIQKSVEVCLLRQKEWRKKSGPQVVLLCCALNLHCLRCLAVALVDIEVQRDAYEANTQ